jgi:hypothetical protein
VPEPPSRRRHLLDPNDPASREHLFEAPPDPRFARARRDDRTQMFPPISGPPPGLPTDRYGEERSPSRSAPLLPAEFAAHLTSPSIRSEGMPTVDRPRSPAPIGTARVAYPPPAPESAAGPHAKRPSTAARAVHAVADFVSGYALKLFPLMLTALLVGWCVSTDREVDRLSRENRDLRDVQITQQQRLRDAETDVEQARSESGEAKEDADNLQRRLTQLEEQDQHDDESGS